MSESFADVPQSIGELRADREDDARAWTPRDLLVSLLRDIDSGKADVAHLAVVWRPLPDPARDGDRYVPQPRFSVAGGAGDPVHTVGMLTWAINRIMS